MLKTMGLILGLALLPALGQRSPPPAPAIPSAPPVFAVRDTLGVMTTALH
jgi:hypothetical protein